MLFGTALAAALVGSAAAAPFAGQRTVVDFLQKRDTAVQPDFNITYSSPVNESLPRTLIMATG